MPASLHEPRPTRERTKPPPAAAVRREDDALLRGRGCFVRDVPLPEGTLHLAFARSAHAHGRIRSLDLEAARQAPGVVAVLTARELGAHTLPEPNRLLADMEGQPAVPLLAGAHVLYLGQPVAIVAARDAASARRAADRVELDVEALPAWSDFDADAPVAARVQYHHGSADEAAGGTRVHAALHSPRVLAMAMEPRACVAHWDASSETLTAWLGTQTPTRAQADLAQTLGIAVEQVRVVTPDVGGAFGSKASVSAEDLLTGLVAQHLRASVRWVASRSEDFVAGMHGRGSRLDGGLTLDAAGRFLALSASLHFTLGASLAYSAVVPMRNAARILPGPYRVARLEVTGQASRSHAAPVTIYRGAGRPEAALLMETLVERAARAAGIDPVALRRRNLIPATAMPCATPTGELLDSGDYAAALDLACARFGYEAARATQQRRRAAGELVGMGVALYIEPCGQGFESARVTLQADGRATVASGSPSQGQGHATTWAQIAATELACRPDQVEVLLGDTATCPPGTGALASRSTAIGGSAIVQACRAALQRLREGATLPITAEARFQSAEAWSYGCVIAQMRIDRETGTPRVEHVVWADDAGRIVNPVLAHGQLVGGAAQGLGQALMERLVYDAGGQLLTGSLMDYAVPRATDMPALEIHSLHTPSPHNLLGAKGVGEAGCIGLPAALLNAAQDALREFGEPDLQLPLRAETLWRVIAGLEPLKEHTT